MRTKIWSDQLQIFLTQDLSGRTHPRTGLRVALGSRVVLLRSTLRVSHARAPGRRSKCSLQFSGSRHLLVEVSTNLNLSGTDLSRTAVLDPAQPDTEDRSRETRRIYDIVAGLYPLSSRLFHSRAHKAAMAAASIQNGETVLEVATGSGEMLRRLVEPNVSGQTIGVDLSPNMAARSQQTTRRRHPASRVDCQAADVRFLPFARQSFDVIVCCYLFELLPEHELGASLQELSRVLKPGGRLVTVLVAQNKPSFNAMYKVCNKVAPAFWGQQVEQRVVKLLSRSGFQLSFDQHIRQIYYSSRVISAQRA